MKNTQQTDSIRGYYRSIEEWKDGGSKELNWDKLATENIHEAIPIDRAPNNMHEKDGRVPTQSSSTNIARSFSETENLSITQPNDTSSPMPAKNQTLNEKRVFPETYKTFSI